MAVYLPVDDPNDVETASVDKSERKITIIYLLYTKVFRSYPTVKSHTFWFRNLRICIYEIYSVGFVIVLSDKVSPGHIV